MWEWSEDIWLGVVKPVCDYSLIASKNFIWSLARLEERGKGYAALFSNVFLFFIKGL